MERRQEQIIECTFVHHGEQVLEILNQVIENSTALYDYAPRKLAQIEEWFSTKEKAGLPVIGVEGANGELAAFGSLGLFRNFPAYKYTAEHSVYVAETQRGRGLGRTILKQLIERAKNADYHVLVGAVDATNLASCSLHEKLGFIRVGTLPQVGFKFGCWLDLALYQLTLETPRRPVDG